jgi:hypothetical protein
MPEAGERKRTAEEKGDVYTATTAEGEELTDQEIPGEYTVATEKDLPAIKENLVKYIEENYEGSEKEELLRKVKKTKELKDLDEVERKIAYDLENARKKLKEIIIEKINEGILTKDEAQELLTELRRKKSIKQINQFREKIEGVKGKEKKEKKETETKKKKEETTKKGRERGGKTTEKRITTRGETKYEKTKAEIRISEAWRGTIIFDAKPHISFFAIAHSHNEPLYNLRAAGLWDWWMGNDVSKKLTLNLILGSDDEVQKFVEALGKLETRLNYEVFVDDTNKKLILKVGREYWTGEQNVIDALKKATYFVGENELKKFLRAGLLSNILQDKDFPFFNIQEQHGKYRVVLKIGETLDNAFEVSTNLTLNDLQKLSDTKTFTELLRTESKNVYINNVIKGDLLYILADKPENFETIDKIIERDIMYGEKFEGGRITELPMKTFTEVEIGRLKTTKSIYEQLLYDLFKMEGGRERIPIFQKLVVKFPEVLWDYKSNYLKEGEAPSIHTFNEFVSKVERNIRGKKTTYLKAIAEIIGEDPSTLTFTRKVEDYLISRGKGVEHHVDVQKLVHGVLDNEKFEEGLRGFYQPIKGINKVIEDMKITANKYIIGKITKEEAVDYFISSLKQFAEEYDYEIDEEGARRLYDNLLKNWEKNREIIDQLEELYRKYDAGEIDDKTFSESVNKAIGKEKIEEAYNKDIKAIQEKFGDKLGETIKVAEKKGLLKAIWKNRAFKFGIPFVIVLGGIWTVIHLLRKKKLETVATPTIQEGKTREEGVAKQEEEEKFRPIYLFPNLWNEYKIARENYKRAVESYSKGLLNFILLSSVFSDGIPDIPAGELVRLKILAEWEGRDFAKIAHGYVVAKRRGITPSSLAELEFYAGIEEPDRMKIDKIASLLEKIYNMNVKMNERLLMQTYDRYKMFMRANIDAIKMQYREYAKRQTLLLKAKTLAKEVEKQLGLKLLLHQEATPKEEEEKAKEMRIGR